MGNKRSILSNRSIIQGCIERSKYIALALSCCHTLKESQFFLNRIPTMSLSHADSPMKLKSELDIYIDGLKRDIARYLAPIFYKEDIRVPEKFSFSSNDLQEGFVELSTKTMENYLVADKMLLLNDVDTGSEQIPMGTIVTWSKFISIKAHVVGVIDSKTFVVHYAMRKSKRHEKK